MIIILFITILSLFAYHFHSFIRKYNLMIYIGAFILAVLIYWGIDTPILTPFRQGFFGLSIFYIVMIAGALKHNTALRKRLMSVRREYSIIGFILVSAHSIHYLIQFLTGEISIPIYGIITYVIMMPLFITSFVIVRKKMSHKTWKRLQQCAYLSYLALFIHIIIQAENIINLAVYIFVFTVYLILKITYEIKKYKRRQPKI